MASLVGLFSTSFFTGAATLFGSSTFLGFAFRFVAVQAITAIAGVRRQNPTAPAPGIRTPFLGRGETAPQSIIVGQYATNGHGICPQMSHVDPNIDGTRADYLNGEWFGGIGTGLWHTYVINLADAPVASLDKVIVNGTEFDFQADMTAISPVYGRGVPSDHATLAEWTERLYVKFYDGTQTAVDPYLFAAYRNHPDRPWKDTSVHTGGAYAIVTVQRDDRVFTRAPEFRFVLTGVALTDDRDASTPASRNPIVQSWNVATGIVLPDGQTWGFGYDPADLPDTDWHTAMDVCDALVFDSDDPPSQQVQYQAGLDIAMATPRSGGNDPATALDDLLAAAAAEVCDVGGTLRMRAGAPGLPIMAITDDDILNSRDQSYQAFDTVAQTYNAVVAQYPHPGSRWEPRESPERVDTTAVALDGEKLVASVQLDAVPYPDQAERLTAAWLADEQRRRVHVIYLPPHLDRVEPLETLTLTSDVHNYTDKLFEVQEMEPDLMSGVVRFVIREVDPDDYVPGIYIGQPDDRVSRTVKDKVAITDWDFLTDVVSDGAKPRRSGLRFRYTHSGNLLDGIEYEVEYRGAVVNRGINPGRGGGEFIVTEGILSDGPYRGRLRPIVRGTETDWTEWRTAESGRAYFQPQDLGDLNRSAQRRLERLEAALAEGLLVQEIRRDTLRASMAGQSAEISQELRVAVSDLQALATATTSLQTTVDGNSTTITETLLSADGVLGQYALVIDNNGAVAGFALISDLINGNPTSSFVVQADAFSINTPDGNVPMFTFYATPTVVNGVTRQGLYITGDLGITGDLIKDGVISRVFKATETGTLAASEERTVALITTAVQSGEAQVDYQLELETTETATDTTGVSYELTTFSTAYPAGMGNTRILKPGVLKPSTTIGGQVFASGTEFEGRPMAPSSNFYLRITNVSALHPVDYSAFVRATLNWSAT